MKEFCAHARSQWGRRYTWHPDLHDQRDRVFERGTVAPLPDMVDLRPDCPPVDDQGDLDACTANAWVAAFHVLDLANGNPMHNGSRLYLYYNQRALRGNQTQDCGAFIRDGAMALAKQGLCPESQWPYDLSKFATRPTVDCYLEGMSRPALIYSRVNQIEIDLCTALAQGHSIVFGFTVYQSFETATVLRTGMVPLPEGHEKTLGGHAALVVGYNQGKKLFTVRNSWGPDWGDRGYCYFPFSYLLNAGLAQDFWIIQVLPDLDIGQHSGQRLA
jgi:C1A family cysteine protease